MALFIGMDEQALQEAEYEFPYHHIPQFGTEPFSETRHLFWGYEYASYTERVLELLGENEFDSLIDVGCGDGRLLLEIAKKFPGKRLVGTDFSERAIAFARAFGPHLDFRSGTLETSIRPGETFSFLTLIEVFEHIPPVEADAFLAGINRLMTINGRGIITVPSTNMPVTPKHFRHFDTDTLTAALAPHFRVVSIEFLNAEIPIVALLRRLFANRLFISNAQTAVDALYRFYKKHYLRASPSSGQRLIAIIEKK